VVPAQLPTVDITMSRNAEGDLEVYVRPDLYFDGVFSSLVFTVRWDEADGISLGAISQPMPQMVYCPTAKSGPEHTSGPYRYQIFAGFGAVAMNNVGASWQAGDEVLIATIDVPTMAGSFELVNDAFTAGANGDYYISLNGEDRTGVIYTFSTAVPTSGEAVATGPVVWPNPAVDRLFVSGLPDGTAELEVTDAAGRTWLRERRTSIAGNIDRPLDITGLAVGAYVLIVRTEVGPAQQRIVVGRSE
jgi:hypothetical protein